MKPRHSRLSLLAATALAGLSIMAWETRALAQDGSAAGVADFRASQVRDFERAVGSVGTSDIDDIRFRADALSAALARCYDIDCPVFETCEQARELEENIEKLIFLLEQQQRFLRLANDDELRNFTNLVNNEILTGEQVAALIEAVALQDALIRFSDSLAQIATIISSVKSLARGDGSKVVNALNAAKLAFAANSLRGTLDQAKSLAADPNSGLSGDDLASISGSIGGALDKIQTAEQALRSAASSGAAAINAQGFNAVARAPTAGQVARGSIIGFENAATRADSSLVEAGEIIQALLSNYAKKTLAERQQRLQESMTVQAPAEARTRAQAFIRLQQVQARRFATEDALAALREAHSRLLDCMGRAVCSPRSRANFADELPDFIERRPDGTTQVRYGSGLVFVLGEIDKLRPKILPVALREDCPDLTDEPVQERQVLLPFAFDSGEFCSFRDGVPFFIPINIPPGEDPESPEPDPDPEGENPPVPPGDDPESPEPGPVPQDPPPTGDPTFVPPVPVPPDEDPEDPEPTPEPDPDPETQRPPPPVLVNVKATSQALAEGQQGRELAGQVVRIPAVSQLPTQVPRFGEARSREEENRDAAASPVGGVTNSRGELELDVTDIVLDALISDLVIAKPASERTEFPFTRGDPFLSIDVTPRESINVLARDPLDLLEVVSRETLVGDLLSVDRIADFSVATFELDKRQSERVVTMILAEFPSLQVEVNLCMVKEPAGITEYHACQLQDAAAWSRTRQLVPPPAGAQFPGSVLILNAPSTDRDKENPS